MPAAWPAALTPVGLPCWNSLLQCPPANTNIAPPASSPPALALQTALTVAVGEEACEFEHRDLHWGNLLIRRSEEPAATAAVGARLRGVELEAVTDGVTVRPLCAGLPWGVNRCEHFEGVKFCSCMLSRLPACHRPHTTPPPPQPLPGHPDRLHAVPPGHRDWRGGFLRPGGRPGAVQGTQGQRAGKPRMFWLGWSGAGWEAGAP